LSDKKTGLWGTISGRISGAANSVGSLFTDTYTGAQDTIARMTADLPDVEVQVFTIHSSAEPDDYTLHFDFDELVKAGCVAKPVIVLWSGRPDMEQEMFARRLTAQFRTKLAHARRVAADSMTAATDATAPITYPPHPHATKAVGLAAAIGAALLLARAHPIVNIVVTALAFLGGKEVIAILTKHALSLFRAKDDTERLKSVMKAIEKQLEVREADMIRKAKKLPIHIHPVLYGAVRELCQEADMSLPPVTVAEDAPPLPESMIEALDPSIQPFYQG